MKSLSFVKRSARSVPIPGTKTSLNNSQLITSSGNPSLDHILGGGMPIGSLLLIEEDKFVTYSKVLVKYFLAEGIFSSQGLFVGSLEEDVPELIKKLPKPVNNPQTNTNRFQPGAPVDIDDMKIAWRYNKLPEMNSEQTITNIGHHFDLTARIDDDTIQKAEIHYFNHSESDGSSDMNKIFHNRKYFTFLQQLETQLKSDKYSSEGTESNRSLLRICISSLGSPLWYDENFVNDFIKFLSILKCMVRCASAICFLTIPTKVLEVLDVTLIPRIRNLVDFSIELESFAGSDKETNPMFKEYNGILYIRKLGALNSLAAFRPETADLAFKLRRKKFVIEKLHLPPDLGENNIEFEESSGSCSSSFNNQHGCI